jgi:hypothetical protein
MTSNFKHKETHGINGLCLALFFCAFVAMLAGCALELAYGVGLASASALGIAFGVFVSACALRTKVV